MKFLVNEQPVTTKERSRCSELMSISICEPNIKIHEIPS